ncbi:MAG: DUF2270 domain-containing protein [Chloroflexi bacterium]|nr:DUF2270 domain-containing protein [Chloroflexota bacterium]
MAVRQQRVSAPAEPAMSSSEVTTALVHLYRAEVTKTNTWRQRLDTTTNWAVVSSGAAISFALGDTMAERHIVILLTSLMVTFFLLLEARRYRHYDVWQTRVHLLESHFFAALLCPTDVPPDAEWRRLLATDLRTPAYHIPFREALGWRLRRNYAWLYVVLLVTWLTKLWLHPQPANTIAGLVAHAAIGPVSGWIVLGASVAFHVSLILIAVITWGMHTASGEVITPAATRQRIEHSPTSHARTPAGA